MDMEEKKRKELEALKSQINPEILKRVADSMASPAQESSRDLDSTPAKREQRAKLMNELQQRIRRREAEVDARRVLEDKKKEAVFLAYDSSPFRAKQILGYLNRMGFTDVVSTSDFQTLIRSLIESINDPETIRTVIAVSEFEYKKLNDQLNGPELAPIRDRVPALTRMPRFCFLDPSSPPVPPPGIDPKWVVSMSHSPGFSGKKIRASLEIRAA